VIVTFDGDEAMVTSGHGGKGIADEIRFGIVVRILEYVGYGERICGEETCAAKESPVDECGAVVVDPVLDEIVVLLVVHLYEIAEEKGGCGWSIEVLEGTAMLCDEETDERGKDVVEEERDEDEDEDDEHGAFTVDGRGA
jgi:hypothetical protein